MPLGPTQACLEYDGIFQVNWLVSCSGVLSTNQSESDKLRIITVHIKLISFTETQNTLGAEPKKIFFFFNSSLT